MRWRSSRRSSNIEDKRGFRASKRVKGGGIGILLLALVALYFGVDPALILQQGAQLTGETTMEKTDYQPTPQEQELADFVSVVLADTEDTWQKIFSAGDASYAEPKLVLFSGQVQSACGFAQAAMGPFYCPGDQKVYIDLSFYQDLKNSLGAPGDFAQAYVIAHEVGHHVQNLLGISDQVHQMRQQLSETEYNQLSVRIELQADCFSGIWTNHANEARQILEQGDIEEALNAASAIGDDRLQKQARGYVTPDSFTHGSSEQRVRWFKTGLKSGDLQSCDTFSAQSL
ncbi:MULTISPECIES: neutral zinc metallopeptidase [Desulfosediminicola]|uniref:KPN_02809 family neutral zinc metallopeptidase n=1 Tax=Desulfosediminicola TaxID=2886823 RepID=UPI0010ACE1F8|nr:neutral zinc metallopeptidase [Desulfosediminicola ganghwensis]